MRSTSATISSLFTAANFSAGISLTVSPPQEKPPKVRA
jgi:hypothetical protein